MTNRNYNLDHARFSDKKLMIDFGKEMYFYERALGKKSVRDKTRIGLLKSPVVMVSGNSTKF